MNDIPYGVLFWGTDRFHRENLERFPIVIARTRIPSAAKPLLPRTALAPYKLSDGGGLHPGAPFTVGRDFRRR